MMRFLLPVVLLLLGVGGGVGAGLMLGGDAPAADPAEGGDVAGEEPAADAAAEEGHGEDAAAADEGHGDAAADDGHGGEGDGTPEPGSTTPSGSGTEFVRLNNQFVVPIVRNGSVRSLVVLALEVEVGIGEGGAVFDREPRLRDSFLRVMFAHANAGGFDGTFTEAAAMEPLREALREAAQGVVGTVTVHDVLITDITRQDA